MIFKNRHVSLLLAVLPLCAAASDDLDAEALDYLKNSDALLASPGSLALWHGLFMIIVTWILARGIQAGIERAVKVLMPALFALLLLVLSVGMLFLTQFARLRLQLEAIVQSAS